jgi:hypothetical protein
MRHSDREFLVARFRIRFATEAVVRQQDNQYFRRRADRASIPYMSAEDTAPFICDADMKMRAIRRQGSGKRQYFQAALDGRRCRQAGKPDIERTEAADTLQYESGGAALFGQYRLEGSTQVLARTKAQRQWSHGDGEERLWVARDSGGIVPTAP